MEMIYLEVASVVVALSVNETVVPSNERNEWDGSSHQPGHSDVCHCQTPLGQICPLLVTVRVHDNISLLYWETHWKINSEIGWRCFFIIKCKSYIVIFLKKNWTSRMQLKAHCIMVFFCRLLIKQNPRRVVYLDVIYIGIIICSFKLPWNEVCCNYVSPVVLFSIFHLTNFSSYLFDFSSSKTG